MVVNFRVHEISRGARKLARTPTLNYIKKKKLSLLNFKKVGVDGKKKMIFLSLFTSSVIGLPCKITLCLGFDTERKRTSPVFNRAQVIAWLRLTG